MTGMGSLSVVSFSGKPYANTKEKCGQQCLSRRGCNSFSFADNWGGYCLLYFPHNADLESQAADLIADGWAHRVRAHDCEENCEIRGNVGSYAGVIYCYNIDNWTRA